MHEEIEQVKKTLIKAQGKGLEYVLNIAYQILGNPIAIFDIAYNLLTNTENIVTDDSLWNELTATGKFCHDTVHFFNTELFISAVANADIVAFLKSDKLKYDRINGKLFDNNNIQLGNMIVVACYKPFENKDYTLIETICEFLSVELQNSEYRHKIGHIFQDSLISDLIEEKIPDKEILENKMGNLYTNLKANLYAAVVDITQYEHTLTHLEYFRDLFEHAQEEFKYYIYLNNIVIIISTNNLILSIKKDLYNLNKLFEKYKLFAGISGRFQNLFELNKYYRQALNALNYGLNLNVGQQVFRYDDFRVICYINSIKDSINIQELCNPIVFSIQEYDKKNNTKYYDILHAYFLTGRNSLLTCEGMNMSHDTLCKHLKRIESIFEIDWDNGNMLTSIFMSIKILKCFHDEF